MTTPAIIRAYAEASLKHDGYPITDGTVATWLCGYSSALLARVEKLERGYSPGFTREDAHKVELPKEPRSL